MTELPPLTIIATALTAEAFAAYGDVIAVSDRATHYGVNNGMAERYHDLAQLDSGSNGRTAISIFRCQPYAVPVHINTMECHPLSSQAFFPLSPLPYLIVVAPSGAEPTIENIRAFLAQPGQGINYLAGVWHHPVLALTTVSDFLVLDRVGDGHNCLEIRLPQPMIVTIGR